MFWTKFKNENKRRAKTQNLDRQEFRFMCTALPLDEIYPPTKFHNRSRQNSSMKVNKGQLLKKQVNKSYGSCAPHSPLMRSIHPQNFINIASIVFEICSGQNSSMKKNEGQ